MCILGLKGLNQITGPQFVTSAKQRRYPCFERLKELPEMRFPLNLIGKSTVAFLTGKPWCLPKPWYTGGSPEQGFRSCFANGLNQKLSSVGGAETQSDFHWEYFSDD